MKKFALLTLASLFLASLAFGALGDIVASWDLPVSSPRGVARSNTYIHYVAYSSPNRVVNLTSTGSFVSSWVCPYTSSNRGLAYSWGGYLWLGNYSNDHVYQCNWSTGSVYASWDSDHDPYGIAPYCTGDGGEGTSYIITYDSSPNAAYYHLPTNGSIVTSTSLADGYSYDMAYDWRNQLLWKYESSPASIYGMNYSTGSLVASFARPYSGTAYGLAYSGQYLYIACSNSWMYQVHCPGTVSVKPASMGKVKAMYH
ncbi:MAG: hypothetical protein PVH29_08810 [Candidatus Zixiibacteriota bacterium]|jgi:hypothetical protein